MAAFAALAGALLGAGVLLIVIGLTPAAPRPANPNRPRSTRTGWSPGLRRRAGVAAVLGLVVLAVTGWPVAAAIATAGAVGLPVVLGAKARADADIARLEALADWVRRLADLLASGAGIEQAIEASVRTVPAPLATPVAQLVASMRAHRATPEALRGLADTLADPTADLVVAALILAAQRRGRGLARALASLAATVESEVAMRRTVEADRAQPRTTARYVAWITVAVAAALVLGNPGYVAPFGTGAGQVALAVVGALFAGAFTWMHALTRPRPGPRWFPAAPVSTAGATAAAGSGVGS